MVNAQAGASAAAACTAEVQQMQQIMQEHSLAIGQVDFLNSIIVDMQRKNQELHAKIEILESSCYAEAHAQANAHAEA